MVANTPNGRTPHIGGGVALLPLGPNGEKQGVDDLRAKGWTWNDIQAFIYSMDEVFNMKTGEFAPKHSVGASFTSSSPKRGSEVDVPLRVIPARQFPKVIKQRECVVAGIVPERHVTTFYGTGGSTKSILVLSLLLAAARGDKEWLGLSTSGRKYNCLFVDFELDLESQAERALKLIYGSGHKELPDGFNYVDAGGKNPPAVFEFLYGYCKDNSVDLMVIDSVGLAMLGDAGAYRDVVAFFRTLDAFRTDLSCTVILVDHQANLTAGES